MLMPWYDYILRGWTIAISLLILSHFMGKRIVGELSVVDFVVGITIGSIAGTVTLDPRVPIWAALLALLTWSVFQWFNIYIGRLSKTFRSIAGEEPTLLVENGTIRKEGLRKANMSEGTLFSELRAQQIADLAEVELATLEPSGKLGLKIRKKQNMAEQMPTFKYNTR